MLEKAPPSLALVAALGREQRELYSGGNGSCATNSEADVRALRPDMAGIVAAGVYGIIVTVARASP